MEKQIIGDAGEDFAAEILEDRGYIILDRNYLCKSGEIDIIAKDDDTFVFVEVKTRKNSLYGTPAEFVDFRKQRKIRSAALNFLKTDAVNMRFDVFEIIYEIIDNEFSVKDYNIIENAF